MKDIDKSKATYEFEPMDPEEGMRYILGKQMFTIIDGNPICCARYIDGSGWVHELELQEQAERNKLPDLPDSECKHENRYLNKITTGLQFWVCPDCKQEVKPPVEWDDDLKKFFGI